MRILFFARPLRRTRNTQHMAAGLRQLGHQVRVVNIRRVRKKQGSSQAEAAARRALRSYRPDLVLLYGKALAAEALEALDIQVPVAMFYPDYTDPPDSEILASARRVDHFFVTNPAQLESYREAGVKRPRFLMQACAGDDHYPVKIASKRWRSEVAFIGRPRTDERIDFLDEIGRSFDLKVWGPGWQSTGLVSHKERVNTADYRRICSSSGIVLGHNMVNHVRLCFSNRTWLTLGCRGLLFTHYVPGLETVFKNMEHLVWYNSADEFMSLARSLLADSGRSNHIREAGYRYVHAEHTYVARMREMLELIYE